MFTRRFWQDTAERMATTAAEFALGAVGGDLANVLDADWKVVAGAAAAGAFMSLCKALIAGRIVGSPDSASLHPEV